MFEDTTLVIIIVAIAFVFGIIVGVPKWDSLQERFVDCLNHDNGPVWCFEQVRK